ncbi:MAG: SirA family protein [candidate division Zixibacteria bacterium]|nr:SirA family protein [candidate division Zixibacteria bacterium]
MDEITTVDARGLSCPAPAVAAKKAMKKRGRGRLEVLVDSPTAKDNVARLAQDDGWKVTLEEISGGGYKLILEK